MLGIHAMDPLANLVVMISILITVLFPERQIRLPELIQHRPVRGVRRGALPQSNAPGA
jgi:hypothetical protein